MSESTSTASLFTPFTLAGVKLPNRFVMSPMTRYFSPDGIPGPDVAAYYAKRARHGVGLIVTEGAVIDHPGSSSSEGVPHMYGDAALAGWAEVVRAVHEEYGRIFAQLWHVGLDPHAGDLLTETDAFVGPSGLVSRGVRVGEPMTEKQIGDVLDAYARAALNARRLGFDGIELHGAHGYLIGQFLWEGTNERTDAWGGDPGRRARFAVEAIEACRRAVGPDYPIVLRYSQWNNTDYSAKIGGTPAELEAHLAPIAASSVDAFHCSTRRFWLPEFDGSVLNLAGWTKKLTGKPAITVGSVGLSNDFVAMFAGGSGDAEKRGIEGVVERLERDEFDLIAVGRQLLGDAEWVAKVRDGRTDEIRSFDPEALASLN
jgi:2,4-dienoyl-CoA reductase-like NADH-dependent reductase (Old Yellow Enzyme family)